MRYQPAGCPQCPQRPQRPESPFRHLTSTYGSLCSQSLNIHTFLRLFFLFWWTQLICLVFFLSFFCPLFSTTFLHIIIIRIAFYGNDNDSQTSLLDDTQVPISILLRGKEISHLNRKRIHPPPFPRDKTKERQLLLTSKENYIHKIKNN